MKNNDTNKTKPTFSFIPELEQILSEINDVENIMDEAVSKSDLINRYADKGAFDNAIQLRDDLVISFLKDKSNAFSDKNKQSASKSSLSNTVARSGVTPKPATIPVAATTRPETASPGTIPEGEIIEVTEIRPTNSTETPNPIPPFKEQTQQLPIVREMSANKPAQQLNNSSSEDLDEELEYKPNRIKQIISFIIYLAMLVISIYLYMTQIM